MGRRAETKPGGRGRAGCQCHPSPSVSPGGPLPGDMAQGHVKSPILPSGNVPLASFLGPVGVDRENSVLGTQMPQLTPPAVTPPALQGLTTSILGSVISGLQKPKQSENGPPASGVRSPHCGTSPSHLGGLRADTKQPSQRGFGGWFLCWSFPLSPPSAFPTGLAPGGAPQRFQDSSQPLPELAQPLASKQPGR